MNVHLTLKLLYIFVLISCSFRTVYTKWVEGHLQTTQNWAFLARFCFLSYEGQFEYQIEFSRDIGIPNLLLYYDDESQWPSVYHSNKTCVEREAVLNRAGQNQIVSLSHWYPENDFSGCVMKPIEQDFPNISSTSNPNKSKNTTKRPNTKSSKNNQTNYDKNVSTEDPRHFDQFLITTPSEIFKSTTDGDLLMENSTKNLSNNEDDFEILENFHENLFLPRENGNANDTDIITNLKDVEKLFDPIEEKNHSTIKKRSASDKYRRGQTKKFNPDPPRSTGTDSFFYKKTKFIVVCHNMRRFRSVRERWWFIAMSNCGENKGLDVKYKFLMTNGPPGDYWHEHFSADEFYVLPILMAFCFAYIFIIFAIVMCSVELKTRQMLHSTYKLFVVSVALQESGIILQSLAYVKYAINGKGSSSTKVFGQLICGLSEISYLLLLVLMAKGYTITRARLKVGYTVKLTVFICCYFITFMALFIYQAQEFDPGEVLYLYESPAGYGLIVLRICAWFMFIYAIVFTIKKYPEKGVFYYPFSLCGTMWFYAGPLFILTANNYIDKWVRESVVIAVLMFITFCGHITFLLLTLPVFANKNFPYHVRTTQIGVMEIAGIVAGNSTVDHFSHNIYTSANHNLGIPQSVIIPLTRRTEELLGSVHHYMPSAPALHMLSPSYNSKPISNGSTVSHISGNIPESLTINNVGPKLSVSTQHSTESATLENCTNNESDSLENRFVPNKTNVDKDHNIIVDRNEIQQSSNGSAIFAEEIQNDYSYKEDPNYIKDINNPFLVGASFRARKGLLEPINRDTNSLAPPLWTIAKSQNKNKSNKSTIKDKSAKNETNYKLQGVIGTFPLPQIPKNISKDKNVQEYDIPKETDSIVLEKDSSNEDSIEILQMPDPNKNESTLALFSVSTSK